MYGHNSEKSHMIRIPFGIEILCCLPYIIMVNIVGEPKSQRGGRSGFGVGNEAYRITASIVDGPGYYSDPNPPWICHVYIGSMFWC